MRQSSLTCAVVLQIVLSGFIQASGIPDKDFRNEHVPGTSTYFAPFEHKSLVEWEVTKRRLKTQILSAAGLSPLPPRTPMHPHVFGRVERPGYSIEKVYLESFPGYYLCGNLFRPLHAKTTAPGILIAHGHFAYGRLENQQLDSGPALGATLAQQGYIAFAYDMVGYNDTNQTTHGFGGPHESLWSFTPFGLQLWNSIRALDFVEGLAGVDPQRIGMTGASGGGTQTFFLAAVDERVRYSAVVNMVSAEMQGGDICENAPGLRIETDNVEIASMMAPRPMLLISTSGDWTRNAPRDVYPAIRKIYELYGKADVFKTAYFNFPHNYNHESRMAAYAFFRQVLTPDLKEPAIVEDEDLPEQLPKMLVFYGLPLPTGARSYDQIFQYWRRVGADATKAMDVHSLESELIEVLGVERPGHIKSEVQGENIVLSREGRGDRVPGLLLGSGNPPVLVVDPQGSAAASTSDAVRLIRSKGSSVLCIDAFQTGAAKTSRKEMEEYFLTFNRSDDANRVQDIVTAIAFLQSKTDAEIHVRGIGRAAIWCLFAAAVSPGKVRLDSDMTGIGASDDELIRTFPVHGIQKAGGVPAALKILESRPAKTNGENRKFQH